MNPWEQRKPLDTAVVQSVVGAVQARPRLESAPDFKKFNLMKRNSAFNLNPVF